MKISVTGHRPNKLGGYTPCESHRAVRRHMRDFLIRAKTEYKDLTIISGGALGIDQWWMAVGHYLKIPVIAALPFHGFDSQWPIEAQKYFRELLDNCDGILYATHDRPQNKQEAVDALFKRNKMLVDMCDLMVAYWDGSSGGTAHAVKLTETAKKDIVIFNPKDIS